MSDKYITELILTGDSYIIVDKNSTLFKKYIYQLVNYKQYHKCNSNIKIILVYTHIWISIGLWLLIVSFILIFRHFILHNMIYCDRSVTWKFNNMVVIQLWILFIFICLYSVSCHYFGSFCNYFVHFIQLITVNKLSVYLICLFLFCYAW